MLRLLGGARRGGEGRAYCVATRTACYELESCPSCAIWTVEFSVLDLYSADRRQPCSESYIDGIDHDVR